jgi:predicted RNase H-like nuclease (RuvC/YqgF family)
MSAGDKMIDAAHLIVKLFEEVSTLKERNVFLTGKAHELSERKNVLEAELKAARDEIECLRANFAIADDWEERAKQAEARFMVLHNEINQLKDTLAQRQSEIDQLRHRKGLQVKHAMQLMNHLNEIAAIATRPYSEDPQ